MREKTISSNLKRPLHVEVEKGGLPYKIIHNNGDSVLVKTGTKCSKSLVAVPHKDINLEEVEVGDTGYVRVHWGEFYLVGYKKKREQEKK